MSSQDNNGLPLPSKDDLPHSDQGESVFLSSNNDGNGYHASPTLPPPTMTLPMSRVERYETTQALLACKHKDGNFVCTHVLKMKSYIAELERSGVILYREQAID